MAKDVRVRIKIDSDSQELIVMNNEVKKLGKAFNESDSYANTFLNRIEKIAGAYIGFQTLNNTLGNIIRTGIEFNSQLETMKIGIGSLISVNSSNVTSTGKTISALEKYNMSINKATEVIDMLKIANKETSATLEELVVGFQATVAPALSAGLSIKETIEYTKLMTQAAGAMGIPMNQLSQELKSVVSGTIDLNSAIASNLGITNEEIRLAKEKGQLFIFLESKLKDFALAGQDVQNSLVGIKSELEDNYNEFAAQFMKPALDNYTNILSSLNDTLKYLNDNNYTIKTLADEFMKLTLAVGSGVVAYKSMNLTMDLFSKTSTISRLTTARLTASLIVQTAITKATTLATQTLNIALRSIPFFAVTGLVYGLTEAFSNNAEKGKVLQDVYSSTSDELKKLTKNQLEYRKELVEEELIKARLNRANALAKSAKTGSTKDRSDADDAIKEFNILQQKSREIKRALQELSLPKIDKADELTSLNKQSDTTSKSIDNLNKAYLDIAQIGMSEYQKTLLGITTQTQNWIDVGVDINYALDAQSKLIDELNTKKVLDTAKEDLSYQERLLQLKTDSYEKELELINLSYTQKALDIQGLNKPIEDKERLLELETELYNKTLERLQLDTNTQFTETISSFYDDMLEAQLNLNGAAYEFGDAFGDIGNKVQQTTKTLVNMANADLQYRKEKSKIDKKYEEQYKKFGKTTEKGQKLELAHNKELDALKAESFKNDLTSLGSLAGSFKAYFDEQSTGYKILSGVEQGMHAARMTMMLMELPHTLALTTAKWGEAAAGATASVTNAGRGDPYTAPKRVAVMVGLMAAAMTMFGGSGGGGSSSQSYSQTEIDKFNIEAEYTPIIDRLDRQSELLEKIERNGRAGAIKVDLAATTFEKDYKLLVNEFLPELHDVIKPDWGAGWLARALNEKQFEDMLGFNLVDGIAKKRFNEGPNGESVLESFTPNFRIDKNSLKQGFNLMRLVETINSDWDYFHNSGFGVLLDKDWRQAGDPMSMTIARIGQITNDMQELLHEYTMSLLDSMQDLKDAKEEYISIYEELTDSRVFTDKKLVDAFKSFDSLLSSGESYADYIYKEINNLQNLEKFLTNDKIEILLSQDATNLKAQLDLLDELKKETGLTFQNGARDAIDFLESIKLVSEALVTSKNNMVSFANSFKSDDMLLNQQAMKIGMPLAKDFDELVSQFKELSSDMFGLTDDELEYLNASKSMIEKKNEELLNAQKEAVDKQIESYEEYINTITKDISKLESIIKSMTSTIDKLRGAVAGSSVGLDKFYASMKESLNLSKTKNYDSFEKSLKDTISQSNALFEKSNFASLWDMQFAQTVAANQFEGMQIDAQTEIDYLKQIEENTRATVLSLQSQLEKMTNSTVASNDKLAGLLDDYISDSKKTSSEKVYELYTKYDLHQFQSDESGYDYWTKELNSGRTLSQVENDIERAAIENAKKMNTPELLEWLKKFGSFAVGTTNVPYDMLAQIHKSEIIVPATFSDGVRAGDISIGDNKEQITLLKDIKNLLQKMDANIENIDDREDYKMRVS